MATKTGQNYNVTEVATPSFPSSPLPTSFLSLPPFIFFPSFLSLLLPFPHPPFPSFFVIPSLATLQPVCLLSTVFRGDAR